eukprot:10179869-Alexandrium_andersonii.AAC.1
MPSWTARALASGCAGARPCESASGGLTNTLCQYDCPPVARPARRRVRICCSWSTPEVGDRPKSEMGGP